MTSEIIALRPVPRGDLDQIRGWLRQPDIEAWWGPSSATAAAVQIATQSPSALCRMIEAGGQAVDYCHAIDATLWGDDLPDDLEPGTWDLDLFIASAEHRGHGVGLKALELLKSEFFRRRWRRRSVYLLRSATRPAGNLARGHGDAAQ